MKAIEARELVSIVNEYYGTTYKTYRQLSKTLEAAKEPMLKRWQASLDRAGGADASPAYEIYHEPDYILEGIHCFQKSKHGVAKALKYFSGAADNAAGERYAGKPLADLEILDIYNGVGLTTAMLALSGAKVESFNNCQPQVDFMNTALAVLGAPGSVVNHTTLPNKKYDVITSLEVFEHYADPLDHLKEVMGLLKPGGYLVESTGFNGSSDNIGHFDSYRMLGWKMPAPKARQTLTKVLLNFFDLEQSNFNQNPQIWRRTDVPLREFTPRMAASACWDMFPAQYGFGSKIFVLLKNGEVWQGDGDRILEHVDRERVAKGLPSVLAGTRQVYRCNEIWPEFFVKLDC